MINSIKGFSEIKKYANSIIAVIKKASDTVSKFN